MDNNNLENIKKYINDMSEIVDSNNIKMQLLIDTVGEYEKILSRLDILSRERKIICHLYETCSFGQDFGAYAETHLEFYDGLNWRWDVMSYHIIEFQKIERTLSGLGI